MGLIFIANVVIVDLTKKADIIFIIPNIVSQTCIHFISTTYTVFHNKAGKVFKLNNFTKFA